MKKKTILTGLFIVAVVSLAYTYKQEQTQPVAVTETKDFTLDQRTKSTDCKINGKLPDHACTPGAIIATATKEEICTSGYSSSVRNVPQKEKDEVYSEYGIASHYAGEYEVDHLVSLELGGSNDISNLFPEAADPKPGFHEKDKYENYLHQQLCDGLIPLKEAQYKIATDWYTNWMSAMPVK